MAALPAVALPDGKRGQILAVLVTIGAVCALWLGIAQPLLDLYDDGAEYLTQRRTLAEKMSSLANTLPMLRKEWDDVAKSGPPTNTTLQGATDAIAAAALQSALETMASGTGVHLTSKEALPAEQAGAYRKIALRITVDSNWKSLIEFLLRIERATPRMFVDELQLHAQPTSEKTRELPLDISFNVLAFRLASSDGGAAASEGAQGQGDTSVPQPNGDQLP